MRECNIKVNSCGRGQVVSVKHHMKQLDSSDHGHSCFLGSLLFLLVLVSNGVRGAPSLSRRHRNGFLMPETFFIGNLTLKKY